jgi:hypothetical protein
MTIIKTTIAATKVWAATYAGLCLVAAPVALYRADDMGAGELGSLLLIGAILSLCAVVVWHEEKRI